MLRDDGRIPRLRAWTAACLVQKTTTPGSKESGVGVIVKQLGFAIGGTLPCRYPHEADEGVLTNRGVDRSTV